MIEIDYTSRYFTEQLNKYIDFSQEIDHKALSNQFHSIDLGRRIVIKKFNKKYKFEALLPFEVKKSICLKNVFFITLPI